MRRRFFITKLKIFGLSILFILPFFFLDAKETKNQSAAADEFLFCSQIIVIYLFRTRCEQF